MLTQRFTFFCSLLGFVILSAVSVPLPIAVPSIFGLIWLVSGRRYLVYTISIYLFLALPSVVSASLAFSKLFNIEETLPPLIQSLLHIPVTAIDPLPDWVIQVSQSPLAGFGFVIFGMLYYATIARVIMKWRLKNFLRAKSLLNR